MAKPYNEISKAAKYKLPGHWDRQVGALVKALEQVDLETEADTYGTGPIINDFEEEIALLLGKEKAVFFPSGTMAQQIAMRIWSDAAGLRKVAYHPLCHLEIHERDGLKVLHQLEPVLLGSSDRLFTIDDLKSAKEPIACVLIELPQREIGGQLPSWEELAEISQYCKAKGIKLHLDGARLFECLPYYGKSAREVCSLFDSVYVSFYKGLGGIAGAVLAGSSEFTEESKVWKRRHGGDLISLYPYIVSAKYCIDRRMSKMKQYWDSALAVAPRFSRLSGVRVVPEVPVCNMFHLHFDMPKETVEGLFSGIIEKYDLALITSIKEIDATHCKSELFFGDSIECIPQEILDRAFEALEEEFRKAGK